MEATGRQQGGREASRSIGSLEYRRRQAAVRQAGSRQNADSSEAPVDSSGVASQF